MFSRSWLRTAAGVSLLLAGAVTAAMAAEFSQPVLPDAPTPSFPQQPSPGGTQTRAQQAPAAPPDNYSLQRAEHQRILGIMPEFQAVNQSGMIQPLTPKEKFHLMWKSSTDPFIFSLDAIVAGIGQAKNSNPGFGQGAQGYFKRFGASYADTFDGNFWGNAVLTVLLKEDPRYFRKGEGYSSLHRALYSAGTALWTHRDDGTSGPNYANVMGNFISGGISNIYYPASDRGIGKTVTGAVTVTAEGTIGSELIEFWPDIARKLFPKRYRQQLEQQNAAPAPAPAVAPAPAPNPR
jgi:hypothetical protein